MKRLFLLLQFFPLFFFCQDLPNAPSDYVTDMNESIYPTDEAALNKKLKTFEDSSGIQVFVYITASLNGEEMQPLCQQIFRQWKIGQAKKNNGVLIAVFTEDKKFRIHTGYGMEGSLPDLLTKKIQDEDMAIYFRANRYYQGIDKGVDKIIYYSKSEFVPDEAGVKLGKGVWMLIITYSIQWFLYIIVMVLLGLIYRGTKDGRNILMVLCSITGLFIPFLGGVILIATLIATLVYKPKKGLQNANVSGNDNYSSSDNSNSSYDSSSSSSSDSSSGSFDGGGGGDSGGGGSDSSW